MERIGYFRRIWASKGWLALFAASAAIVAYLYSSAETDRYESKALGQIVSTSQASGEILNDEQLLSLSNIYGELARTTTVVEMARKSPDVKEHAAEFDESVSVEPQSRVGLLGFAANTEDPALSAAFANAYAEAFSTYLAELQVSQRADSLEPIEERIEAINRELGELGSGDPKATGLQLELQALQERAANETASPGDTMRVVERAIPAGTPVSPRPKRDAVLALIGALVLGAGAIYLRDIFFDRYRSSEEATRDLGLPLLGEIPKARGGAPIEAFRNLRTAVALSLDRSGRARSNGAGVSHGRSLLVTGAESGCGKSYIAANLARTLASEDRRVTAIDADLRRPTLHEIFRLPLSPGLSDLLVEGGRSPGIDEVSVKVKLPPSAGATSGELQVIPAGPHADDSVEALSSERMRTIVEQLEDENDLLVLDSPPTLVVVDPVVLARYADGLVFVIDTRRTRRREARRAVEALRAIEAPLLGLVFNRSEVRQTRYEAYRPRVKLPGAGSRRESRV